MTIAKPYNHKDTTMTYKRFPPEGYIQKVLFYSFCLIVWPVFGLHRSPHIMQSTDCGARAEIVDIEHDVDINEECNYCGSKATKSVFLVSWEMVHFCNKHFNKSLFSKVTTE